MPLTDFAAPVTQHGLHNGRHLRSTRLVYGIVFFLICLLSQDFVEDLWHHSDYRSLSSH